MKMCEKWRQAVSSLAFMILNSVELRQPTKWHMRHHHHLSLGKDKCTRVKRIWQSKPRNYIGIAVLLYYTLSSMRSAGLFATNKAKPSIAQQSTVRRKYWQMHADILPDFDLAIQPRFTAENVNKSLPPFLYSSLILSKVWYFSN